MQLEVLGRFLVDFLEESQPRLMAVLTLDATDQFALDIIQCCEQRDRAVASVIMGFCLDMTDPPEVAQAACVPRLAPDFSRRSRAPTPCLAGPSTGR